MRCLARHMVFLFLLVVLALNSTNIALASTRELRVYNYSQYIDPEVLEIFWRETGIRVIYDEYEAAEEAWAKLLAGGGGYDLIIIAHTHLKLAIDRGLVKPIDKSKIPNLANLDPRLQGYPADPTLEYSIPYGWGATIIAYAKDCVASPPGTWREFLSPEFLEKYSGKVTLLSEGTDIVESIMIALGYDITDDASWSKEVIDDVIEHLKRIRGYLRGFWGFSEFSQALLRRDICLAQAWSGDILYLTTVDPNIDYVIPEDGLYIWIDFMVIPRDARNVEEAYMFINFLLRPDIAARNVKYTFYPSPVAEDILRRYAVETNDSELLAMLDSKILYLRDYRFVISPYLDEAKLEMVNRVMTEAQVTRPLQFYLLVTLVIAAVIVAVAVFLKRRG